MYVISKMPDSKVCFGECIEDGFYVEGKNYFEVQEKLEKHEAEKENRNDKAYDQK